MTRVIGKCLTALIAVGLAATWLSGSASADDAMDALTAKADKLVVGLDTVWVMVAGMLVFFMNLGFGCVESGFARAKNCVNILSKNFVVFAATSIAYWAVGWGIMFGSGSPYFGKEGIAMVNGGVDNSPAMSSLATLIKSDLKAEPYKLDLSDADVAKANEKLVGEIDELSEKARTTITANKEKKSVDAKEETDVEFPVSLTVGDKKFEKKYKAASFYWGPYPSISWTGVPLWAKFFFQLVFAGTAATIVSGAVAERIKYLSFIVFSFLMAIVMYPVTGHWVWGGGWLSAAGFWDFAGCAVVHSVGGWAALTGAYILGPRIGKYSAEGKVQAIPGHNMTAAFIGCLVLWLGWFGFNPGSTMTVGDGVAIAKIAVNTNAAAAISTLTATATAWIMLGKPDIGMTLNGCLAGLVAITAPCAWVSMVDSLIIGGVAGSFVVFSVMFFDKIKCDDPVGATSVHLGCGTLGCIAVGLFAEVPAAGALQPGAGLFHGGGMTQLIAQLKGVAVIGVYTALVSAICWFVIKATIGLRVSPEEEIEGLDYGEHGNEAYHGFVMAKSEG